MSLIETKISKALKAFKDKATESITGADLDAANAVLTEEGISSVEISVAGTMKAATDAAAEVVKLKADLAAAGNKADLDAANKKATDAEAKYTTLKEQFDALAKLAPAAAATIIKTDAGAEAAHTSTQEGKMAKYKTSVDKEAEELNK